MHQGKKMGSFLTNDIYNMLTAHIICVITQANFTEYVLYIYNFEVNTLLGQFPLQDFRFFFVFDKIGFWMILKLLFLDNNQMNAGKFLN